MSETEIENLKGALRARLRRDFTEVPSARDTSRRAHLEVWESKRGRRAIGIEFDHTNSNLSGYTQFVTRPIARLGIKTLDEAMLVLDGLCR